LLSDTALTPQERNKKKRAIISWCLFDWANSPHPTVIITFLFSAYFSKAVVGDEIHGTFLWGHALAISGVVVAILSPFLGAIAEQTGHLKKWILCFSVLAISATLTLWFVTPSQASIPLALIAVSIGVVSFEFTNLFYNATLISVSPAHLVGRVSGWGWGTGYIGAIICLTLCLFGLVQNPPQFLRLDTQLAEHIRATSVIVGIWWIIFGWPFFIFCPDTKRTTPLIQSIKPGLKSLQNTLRELKHYPSIWVFLLARMIYADGLLILFQFGGIYAAGTFGLDFSEILVFGIFMNISAGFGAFVFGWIDDKFGSKITVITSLLGLIIFGSAILIATDIILFWLAGLTMSFFIGPAQASSRTLLSRITPPSIQIKMYGLYSMSGKCTSFLGPMLFGWATLLFESQRAGMAVAIIFWIIGLGVLFFVREDYSSRELSPNHLSK